MMRVVTLRSYGLFVTHRVLPPPKHFNHRRYSNLSPGMGSTEVWNAVKVRKTFIEFFEKNGHKFGKSIS